MFSLFAVAILSIGSQSVSAQKITNGPQAPVTIGSDKILATARACAAKCVSYNGPYYCGIAGYYDLGQALACGCASANGCYCNTAYASSATSFLSSCVSAGCVKSVADWTVDLGSMLGLYDNYCKTANVEPTSISFSATVKTTGASSAATTTTAAAGKGSTDGSIASRTGSASNAPATTSASDSTSSSGDNKGMSGTTILALAVGLGVGVPLLLIIGFAFCCCVVVKKRRSKRAAKNSAPEGQSMMQATPPAYVAATAAQNEKPAPIAAWTPADGRHELDPRQYDGATVTNSGHNTPAQTWTPSPAPTNTHYEAPPQNRFEVPGQPASRFELGHQPPHDIVSPNTTGNTVHNTPGQTWNAPQYPRYEMGS